MYKIVKVSQRIKLVSLIRRYNIILFHGLIKASVHNTHSFPTLLSAMPRAKVKDSKRAKKTEVLPIKVEPEEVLEQCESETVPNLNQFKFEKKTHIKIEFENESKIKEESKGLWEPPNWQEFLLNLRIMRENNDAPVDSMGCHKAMDEKAAPEVMRYHSLIALMLSSQTKDQVTFAAMERLKSRGLTVDNVLDMSDEELGQLIYPVGFWKTKVKYIKKTTQTLKDQYNGDIPDSVEKLCKLTGVGPKMAHICMQVAWNKITGIGVDTHVHRISNRIGWVKKTTPTPEDTRKALESWLPFDLWSQVNHLLVGFGQTICLPIGPHCHECLNKDICPSSHLGKSPKKLTPKSPKVKEEIEDGEDFLKPVEKAARNRKVTPKKEKLLGSPDDKKTFNKGALKTQTKVTPQNRDNDKSVSKLEFEFENKNDILDTKTVQSKRMVTPKKTNSLTNNDLVVSDILDTIKNKLTISNESSSNQKKSPRKKSISTKCASSGSFEDDAKISSDNKVLTTHANFSTKVAPKRKSPRVKKDIVKYENEKDVKKKKSVK